MAVGYTKTKVVTDAMMWFDKLTCYWQIAPHRNDISFDNWMSMDMKYIEERSFWADWQIIFMTV